MPALLHQIPNNPARTWDDAWYSGLNQTHYGAYHVTFLLQFEGEYAWTYQLDTRANGQVTEQMLHLEGPNQAQNLGDVRLVSQAGTNQMRGAGTEDLCLQYPSGFNLGPAFLTPDDLISPATVSPLLTAQFQEAGRRRGSPTLQLPARRAGKLARYPSRHVVG